MSMDVCANCGVPITLTRLECDHCGWAPQSKRMREELQQRKERAIQWKEMMLMEATATKEERR